MSHQTPHGDAVGVVWAWSGRMREWFGGGPGVVSEWSGSVSSVYVVYIVYM